MPLPTKGLLSKELVNVPVQLLYARNELLKKIIANAAKRKSQLHINATGDRMAATPEAFQFGKNVFSQMHKKSGVEQVARGAVNFAKGVGKGHFGDMLEGLTPKAQGLKRYLELLTFGRARNMQAKADNLFLQRSPFKLSPEQTRQIHDAIGLESAKSLGTGLGTGAAGMVGLEHMMSPGQPAAKQAGAPPAARPFVNGIDRDGPSAIERMLFKAWHPAHKFVFDMLRDHSKPIVGGIPMPQKPALPTKQSDNLPTPTSRGNTKKITMPEANKSEPDCDPEGVQMTAQDHAKKAFMTGATVGALGGLATSSKGKRHLGMGRGALIGGGTELGMYPGAMLGGLGGMGLAGLASAIASKDGPTPGALAAGGLAGAGLGAAAGGYAGHVGTKALLDDGSHSKQKKNDEEDDEDDKHDKDVKEAAAAMLAYLRTQQG